MRTLHKRGVPWLWGGVNHNGIKRQIVDMGNLNEDAKGVRGFHHWGRNEDRSRC